MIDNDSEPVMGTIDIDKQNVGVDGIRVGNKLTSNGEFFQGDLAEIRIFDSALSTGELTGELETVKQRWGLDFVSRVPEITSSEPAGEEAVDVLAKLNLKPTPREMEFFENKVRPVLAENCYRCHGENEEKRKAGLRLDSLAGLLAGGDSGAALVPGNPDKSLFIAAIRYGDENTAMPPKQKLKDAEIAALTDWVAMGSPWPGFDRESLSEAQKPDASFDWDLFRKDHWAFRPIATPVPPAVKDQDWPKNEIDRFVLSRMELAGLVPNESADKRTPDQAGPSRSHWIASDA